MLNPFHGYAAKKRVVAPILAATIPLAAVGLGGIAAATDGTRLGLRRGDWPRATLRAPSP